MDKRGMSMPSLLIPEVNESSPVIKEDEQFLVGGGNADKKEESDEDVSEGEENKEKIMLSLKIPTREKSPKAMGMGSISPQCGILMYPEKVKSPEASPHYDMDIMSDGGSRIIKQRQRMSLWSFIAVEFLGERHSTGLDDSVPKAIDNFLAVPARFERFVAFGLLVCLDTFLDTVTLLPVRAILAAFALGGIAMRRTGEALGLRSKDERDTSSSTIHKEGSDYFPLKRSNSVVRRIAEELKYHASRLKFDRARAYDLMRFLVIVVCACMLRLVSMSQAYHWIRGQNTIKLYVIIGIMEVFDRLACAFGQDAQDSLYLATRNYRSQRILLFLFVVMGVVLVHAALLYVHITTLNVVVNASEDSAIVALLVSNNFSEIKSFVFKKYNAHNLFDVACADVCERFKICLFLSLLLALSWSQVARGTDANSISRRTASLRAITAQAAVVAGFEVVADWLKHAFMAKFNKLDARVYDAYADRLARDVVTGRGGGIALDHTHAVTRRLGLAVLPLACVAHRYLSIALTWLKISLELSDFALAFLCVLGLVVALELKVLTSVLLAGVSIQRHARFTEEMERKDAGAPPPSSKKNSTSASAHLQTEKVPVADITAKSPRRASLPPNQLLHFGNLGPSERRTSNRSSFLDDPRLNTRQIARSPSSPKFEAALRRFHRRQDSADDPSAILPPSYHFPGNPAEHSIRPRAHTIDPPSSK